MTSPEGPCAGADRPAEESGMKTKRNARRGWIAGAGLALALGLSAAAAVAEEPASIEKQVQDLQVQALQQDMLSDPDLLLRVLALQEDSVVQEILSDAELMAKIEAGDLSALVGDPRIERLADHPTVRGIAGDLER